MHIMKPAHRTLLTCGALSLVAASAQAHLGYSNRHFGTLVEGSSVTIATQRVTSNYGWADASDLSLSFNAALGGAPRTDGGFASTTSGTDELLLGDSHKARAFRLRLESTLNVTLTAQSLNNSGLVAAFSVYQGLGALSPFTAPQTSADHDFNPAAQAWRATYAQSVLGAGVDHLATQGSWNALGNWSMAGDGDVAGQASALSTFVYQGSAFSTVADGVATTTLTLGPGDYTVMVGGNQIAAKTLADASTPYAFSLAVSATTPVPEPQTCALALAGMGLLAIRRLRRSAP